MIVTQRRSACLWAGERLSVILMTRAALAMRSRSLSLAERVQQDAQAICKALGVLAAFDNADPALRKLPFLHCGQCRFVFDGIRDPAKQIGVAHRIPQTGRQLGNGECKCAGNALQTFRLVREIAFEGGFANCRFQLRHPL